MRKTGLALLLELEVLQVVLAVGEPVPEQPVDLVQISADTRTGFDPVRKLAADKLTGLQLNHFGAFYKRSWRANDWLWGRLDGVGWLVHLLLEPRRLLECSVGKGPDDANRSKPPLQERLHVDQLGARGRWVYGELERIATFAAPGDERVRSYLSGLWRQDEDKVVRELLFLDGLGRHGDDELPQSLPNTSVAVARGLQYEVLLEELPQVRGAVLLDARDGASTKATGAFCWDYDNAWDPAVGTRDPATPVKLLQECGISRERIAGEVGSDLMTFTTTTAGATGLSAITQAVPKMPGFISPAVVFARGILLTLWFLMRAALQQGRTWFAAGTLCFALGIILLARGVGPPWNVLGVGLVAAPLLLLGSRMTWMLATHWRRRTRLTLALVGIVALLTAPLGWALVRWPHPRAAPPLRLNLAWAVSHPLWALAVAGVIAMLLVGFWMVGTIQSRPGRLDRALRHMADNLERQHNRVATALAGRRRDSAVTSPERQGAQRFGLPVTIALRLQPALAAALDRAPGSDASLPTDRLSGCARNVVRLAKRLLKDVQATEPRPTWCLLTLRSESEWRERPPAAGTPRLVVLEVHAVRTVAAGDGGAARGPPPRDGYRIARTHPRAWRAVRALAAEIEAAPEPDSGDEALGPPVVRVRFPLDRAQRPAEDQRRERPGPTVGIRPLTQAFLRRTRPPERRLGA